MRTPSSGQRKPRSRGRDLLALLVPVVLATAACGSTTPPAPTVAVPAVPGASGGAQPAASTGPQPPVLAGGDWAGFRGDAGRLGIGLQGPTGNPVLNWQFKAGGGVPNNIAVVGDSVFFASDDGVVHAVGRTSGTEAWKVQLATPTVRGPLAADGRLYFADESGAVIALDATSAGKDVWRSKATYPGTTELLSVAGSLYFGTADGFLVALDAKTGAEQWKVALSATGASVHNPAYADGFIYAGTAGAGFVAVDTATHRVAWTGDLGGDDTGSASAGNGVAYIATPADATTGKLRAFEAKTGKPLWTGPSPMLTTPNVIDGVAYSSTMAGLVDAIDASTGALRWSVQLSGKIRPMAVVGTTLYLSADTEQRVYAIEATTGKKLWQFDVDGPSDCCIAVAKGAVYVGTLTGSVYSIGGDGATVAAVPFASPAASAAPTAAAVAPIAASTSWSTDIRDSGFAPISQLAVDPTGRIWAPEANADRIAIFDRNGKKLEEWGSSGSDPGQFDFARPDGDGYGTLAFAKDGSFFVLDVGNRRVQHFDAKRTFLGQWGEFGDGPRQYHDPIGIAVGDDGTVWVLDDQRLVIEHYDAKGKVLGSFDPTASLPMPDGANALAIDLHGNLYVSVAAPSKIGVFDPTGKLLRVVGEGVFAEQATHMAIDAAGRLFVTQGPNRGEAPGVLVFAADGSVLGGFSPIGSGDGETVFPAGIVFDASGGLIVEDSEFDSQRLIRFELPAVIGK